MKLMLAMATPIAWAGRLIPVAHSPFVIGREAGCHLRANTPMVGARHCAVVVHGDHVFVRDLAGSPGTRVNDHPVPGQLEVHDQDRIRAGVLEFTIRLEEEAATPQTETPPEASDEDAAASLLLGMEEEEAEASPAYSLAAETVLDGQPTTPSPAKSAAPEAPDTSEAARRLLARFQKPRGQKRGPAS